MKIKRLLYLIIALAAILVFFLRQTYFAEKWRLYEDNDVNFAVAYPATWFKDHFYHCTTCQYIDLLVMDVPVLDRIELRVYSINESEFKPKNKISFGKWIIYKNSKHVHILAEKDVQIGKHSYSGKEVFYDDKTFRGRIITLIHGGRVYAIEISAIEKKWEEANTIFDKILKTFVFLE